MSTEGENGPEVAGGRLDEVSKMSQIVQPQCKGS